MIYPLKESWYMGWQDGITLKFGGNPKFSDHIYTKAYLAEYRQGLADGQEFAKEFFEAIGFVEEASSWRYLKSTIIGALLVLTILLILIKIWGVLGLNGLSTNSGKSWISKEPGKRSVS